MLPRPSSHAPAIGPGCAGPAVAHPTPVGLDFQQQQPGHRPQAPTCGAEAFMVDPAALAAAGGGGHRQHTQ